MFTQAELQEWRAVLLKLRDRLDADAAQVRAEATHPCGGESAGGLSNRPLHQADVGSQEAEEAVALGLAENEAELVREVEEALDRIRERRFGICEECLCEIPRGRLAVVPYARTCVPCAEKLGR